MKREKKEAIKTTVNLEKAIVERVEQYSYVSGVSKTKIIEFALTEYLKRVEKTNDSR